MSVVREHRMLKAAVSATRMAMAITDPHQPDNPIVLANEAFLTMTGYRADEVLGRNCRFLQGPETDERAIAAIRDALKAQREIQIEIVNYRRDGSSFLNELMIKPIFDEQGSLVHFFASQVDLTPQRQAEALTQATEQRLRLVADELSHRVRNTLSTVQAIVRQTVRNSSVPPDVSDVIGARLVALGRAHEALTHHDWERAELRTVISNTVHPHHDVPARFRIDGPEIYLGAKSTMAVAMAIHELCTNATKYGALSVGAGTIDIAWSLRTEDQAEQFYLKWQEHGGPPVGVPSHRGFGSTLIREALAADLAGEVDITYDPAGLLCEIRAILP